MRKTTIQQESHQDFIKAKKFSMILGTLIVLSFLIIQSLIKRDLNNLPIILAVIGISIFTFRSDLRRTKKFLTEHWLDEIRKTKSWN